MAHSSPRYSDDEGQQKPVAKKPTIKLKLKLNSYPSASASSTSTSRSAAAAAAPEEDRKSKKRHKKKHKKSKHHKRPRLEERHQPFDDDDDEDFDDEDDETIETDDYVTERRDTRTRLTPHGNHASGIDSRKLQQQKQKQAKRVPTVVRVETETEDEGDPTDSFEDGDMLEHNYYQHPTDVDDYYHPTDTKRPSTSLKAARKNSSTTTAINAQRIADHKRPLGRPPKTQSQRRSSSLKGNTVAEKPKKRGRPTNKAKAAAAQAYMSQMAAANKANNAEHRKDVKTIMLKLLDNIQKRDAYGFFLEPVNPQYVPDYLKIIKEPMDFSTMRKKIEDGEYGDSIDGFRYDFKLIVTNAKTYNAVDTIYYKSADKILDVGTRLIDRAEKQIEEEKLQAEILASQQQEAAQHSFITDASPVSTPSTFDDIPLTLGAVAASETRKLSISFTGRKDSIGFKEEDVDIMSIDTTIPTLRKQSRQGSEVRESSIDLSNSRAMTPIQSLSGATPYKKKKKKAADVGVIYGPDGSVHTVGGVPDPTTLIPLENPFHDLPEMTLPNPAALPSAFFLNKHAADEFHMNKHFVRPAQFSDYGPFTTLGTQPPGAFYTALDASYIYPIFGDDRGEAYLKSLWDFLGSEEDEEEDSKEDGKDIRAIHKLKEVIEEKSNHLTRGAWKVVQQALERKNDYVGENAQEARDKNFDAVETEFGPVEAAAIIDKIQAKMAPSTPATSNATDPTTTASAVSTASPTPAIVQ